jgi:predicted transcriptional regulator
MGSLDRSDSWISEAERKDRQRKEDALAVVHSLVSSGVMIDVRQRMTVFDVAFTAVCVVDCVEHIIDHMEPEESITKAELMQRIEHRLRRVD